MFGATRRFKVFQTSPTMFGATRPFKVFPALVLVTAMVAMEFGYGSPQATEWPLPPTQATTRTWWRTPFIAMSENSSTPFLACVDDADCDYFDGHACFQYICYPWKNDSSIPETQRKQSCKNDDDCDQDGETCFIREFFCSEDCDEIFVNNPNPHRWIVVRGIVNRWSVVRGICVENTGECDRFGGHAHCPGRRCCGGEYCCDEEYFNQLAALPCSSHNFCNSLLEGDFCCPRNATYSVCCSDRPKSPPRTTRAPRTTPTPSV